MDQKYSKIYFLVHPLYFPLVGDLEGSKFSFVASKILGLYGKKVLEASKDPGAFFIIVRPAYKEILSYGRMLYKVSFWERMLFEPLIAFAQSKLGKRLYVTNYDFRHKDKTSALLPKDFKNLFKRKIRIDAFGEYSDYCVGSWSRELEELLINNNFTVHLSIDEKSSIPYDKEKVNVRETFLDRLRLRKKQTYKKQAITSSIKRVI